MTNSRPACDYHTPLTHWGIPENWCLKKSSFLNHPFGRKIDFTWCFPYTSVTQNLSTELCGHSVQWCPSPIILVSNLEQIGTINDWNALWIANTRRDRSGTNGNATVWPTPTKMRYVPKVGRLQIYLTVFFLVLETNSILMPKFGT